MGSRFGRIEKSASHRATGRGASLIEAVVAIPIFFLLLIGIIDITRFGYYWVMMNYAAYSAVDFAAKVGVEAGLDETTCVVGSGGTECTRYRERLQEITDRAVRLAEAAGIGRSGSGSSVELVRMLHYSSTMYTGANSYFDNNDLQETAVAGHNTPVDFEADVAFLRPGEAVIEQTGTRALREVHHSFRQFGNRSVGDGSIPGDKPRPFGWPQIQNGESWPAVLETDPVEVRLEADFRPLTFFLPTLRISARQFAYRRTQLQGQRGPVLGTTTSSTSTSTTTTITTITTTTATSTTTSSSTSSTSTSSTSTSSTSTSTSTSTSMTTSTSTSSTSTSTTNTSTTSTSITSTSTSTTSTSTSTTSTSTTSTSTTVTSTSVTSTSTSTTTTTTVTSSTATTSTSTSSTSLTTTSTSTSSTSTSITTTSITTTSTSSTSTTTTTRTSTTTSTSTSTTKTTTTSTSTTSTSSTTTTSTITTTTDRCVVNNCDFLCNTIGDSEAACSPTVCEGCSVCTGLCSAGG